MIKSGFNTSNSDNTHLFYTHNICQLKSFDGWSIKEPGLIHIFYNKHEAGNYVRRFELTSKGEPSGKGIQRGSKGGGVAEADNIKANLLQSWSFLLISRS